MMLHSGADGIPLKYEGTSTASYADDVLMLCVRGATHWDSLGHVKRPGQVHDVATRWLATYFVGRALQYTDPNLGFGQLLIE